MKLEKEQINIIQTISVNVIFKNGLVYCLVNIHIIYFFINHMYIDIRGNGNGNCTISIPKGNLYCRHKSCTRGPRFKVSSVLSTKIDILI